MSGVVYAILAYSALILGGCAYAVFWLGASGWWFLLAILLLPSGGDDA